MPGVRGGGRKGGGCDHKEGDLCGDGIVCVLIAVVVTEIYIHVIKRYRTTHVHCANVGFLVLMGYCNIVRHNYWGKLDERYVGSPHTVFATS